MARTYSSLFLHTKIEFFTINTEVLLNNHNNEADRNAPDEAHLRQSTAE